MWHLGRNLLADGYLFGGYSRLFYRDKAADHNLVRQALLFPNVNAFRQKKTIIK
jgi:hypothetical protein